MRASLIATIKKLLRRSLADRSPEARAAAEAARTLMERYGVTVDIAEHRVVVPGAERAIWRERLLVAIAKRNRCRLERDPAKNRIYAVGDQDDVERVRETYGRAFLHLAVKARTAMPVAPSSPQYSPFQEFYGGGVLTTEPPLLERRDRVSDREEAFFMRAFGVAASDEAININTAKAPVPVVSKPVEHAMDNRMKTEIDELRSEIAQIGARAQYLLDRARGAGIAAMREFKWEATPRQLLLNGRPANAGRFYFLEID